MVQEINTSLMLLLKNYGFCSYGVKKFTVFSKNGQISVTSYQPEFEDCNSYETELIKYVEAGCKVIFVGNQEDVEAYEDFLLSEEERE